MCSRGELVMTDNGLTLPNPTDGKAALTATLDWLRTPNSINGFGKLALQSQNDSGASGSLASYLATAGLMGWHDAIVAAASPGQPLHLDPRLRWLMSHAALEVAVGGDQADFFQTVEQLQTFGGLGDVALAAAVCSRVVQMTGDYPLLARLRSRLQMLWHSPFNERLRRYAEATATRSLTSRDLWPTHNGVPIGDRWAHQVAATLWPDRYMEMLASFPAPFQSELGYLLWPIDLKLAANLVRASPAVFSIDGVPMGPVVVFALLDAVETQYSTLDAQNIAVAESGLSSFLDCVFSRSDGNWIARAWLQQVIWRNTPRRAGRNETDVNAQRALRDTLIVQLSRRILPLGEAVFDWVHQEEPLWRVHRALSEASILEAHGDAIGAAEILASAVRQGLVSSTGRPEGLPTNLPEATIVARVLSQLPDMKLWFETLWRDTYELREHLSYQAHRDLDNPAYPALAWGLIGLNSSRATSVDTAEFWSMIAAAVFETQRIDPNAGLFNGAIPPITRVTVQLGAALVERDTLPVSDFADFLADQIEPTAEYARLWHIARSEASDNLTLAAGRLVGADLLRQAIMAGLAQKLPAWDAVLDRLARDDLTVFSSQL